MMTKSGETERHTGLFKKEEQGSKWAVVLTRPEQKQKKKE
jgi:hypothetical protein